MTTLGTPLVLLFTVTIFLFLQLQSATSAPAFCATCPCHSHPAGTTIRKGFISYASTSNNDCHDHDDSQAEDENDASPSPPTTPQRPSCGGCCRHPPRNAPDGDVASPPAASALVEMTPPPPDLVRSYDRPRNSAADEFFSRSMSTGMKGYEARARRHKTGLFRTLFDSLVRDRTRGSGAGDDLPVILEVGMGTFPNAPYYARAVEGGASRGFDIVGVDPNDSMFDYARESAEQSGLLSSSPGTSLRNVHGVAEALPFADGSVDAVVATLVLCSATDQERALSEIRRVLKPETGKFLFWEHVLSEDSAGLALQQKVLSPLQTLVADGCHLNRRTGVNIQNAGFGGGVEMTYMNLDSSYLISPTVFGIATA